MTRNVTLRLDDSILKHCRKLAVDQDKSLSKWLTDLILQNVLHQTEVTKAKRNAIKRLNKGFNLGGKPLSRNELHER